MATLPATEKDGWLSDVQELLRTVEGWSRDQEWQVRRGRVTLDEEVLGQYEVDELTIESPEGCLVVEPVARFAAGGEGRVDLYAMPSMHRFMIVRNNGGWSLKTDAGVSWPQSWNKQTFLELATELFHLR